MYITLSLPHSTCETSCMYKPVSHNTSMNTKLAVIVNGKVFPFLDLFQGNTQDVCITVLLYIYKCPFMLIIATLVAFHVVTKIEPNGRA